MDSAGLEIGLGRWRRRGESRSGTKESPCIEHRRRLVASLNGPYLGERRYLCSRPSVYPRPTPTLARHVGVPCASGWCKRAEPCASRWCKRVVSVVQRGSAPASADWPGGRTRMCVPSRSRRRETRRRDTPALVKTAGERRTTTVRRTGVVAGHVDTDCKPDLIRAGQQGVSSRHSPVVDLFVKHSCFSLCLPRGGQPAPSCTVSKRRSEL
jgi:hypothetical protein